MNGIVVPDFPRRCSPELFHIHIFSYHLGFQRRGRYACTRTVSTIFSTLGTQGS
jgi:hypothetical protein